MSAACDQATEGVGNGVAASLAAVDCTAGEMAAQAFGRLFASGGALGPVLTIVLTLFIAIFAITLLLGRSRLSIGTLTPRMVTLGLVLTFATSWLAYQSVVWNLAIFAPDWLAGVLTGDSGSATQTFAQKLDVVFGAVQQATADQDPDVSAFSPPGLLWLGAMLLLLGTAGVLVTARIALAVLVALGPVFVVLALFDGTRGMFVGWLKGIVMLGLTPLFAVLAGGVMLELSVPILRNLTAIPGEIDQQAAVAFFLLGAVHMALMAMVLKVSSTMVAGWRVFGLAPDKEQRAIETASAAAATGAAQAAAGAAAAQSTVAQPSAPTPSARRTIPTGAMATAAPANDAGVGSGAGSSRVTKVYASTADAAPIAFSGVSRAAGIGSRFRAPNTAGSVARRKEKTT